MAQAVLYRFARTRLLNQLHNYRAFAQPPASTAGPLPSENPVYEYSQNSHACASVAGAMAFRAMISYSQGGFGLFKDSSSYAAKNAGYSAPSPIAIGTAFDYDWYDVFLMSQLTTLIGAVNKNSDPAMDGDVTKGIGKIFGLTTEFVDSAQADFKWNYRRVMATQMGTVGSWQVLPGYYPTINGGSLKVLLNNCTQIIIVYLLCQPAIDINNMPILGPNGSIIYDARFANEHAVVINGWTTDPIKGDIFMTFDPWGAPFNPPNVFSGRIFKPGHGENGAWEYIQFSQQQASVGFLHYSDKPTPTNFVVLSQNGGAKFGNPFFMTNACGADNASPWVRAITGIGTLSLKNDHTNINLINIDSDGLCMPTQLIPGLNAIHLNPDHHAHGLDDPSSQHSPTTSGPAASGERVIIRIPAKK